MLKRTLFGLNALVAWAGVVMEFSLSASGYYPPDLRVPTLYGNNPLGEAGAVSRIFDTLSYFTFWTALLTAIVMTILALRPDADHPMLRVLRLDVLLMSIVTGLIFNLMLNDGAHTGADWWSNNLVHVWGPIVTVLVWLVAGPREWLKASTIWLSLILPITWVAIVLVRGAVIGAYPYNFLDVSTKGLGSALLFIVEVAIFAVLVGFVLKGIDALIRKVLPRA